LQRPRLAQAAQTARGAATPPDATHRVREFQRDRVERRAQLAALIGARGAQLELAEPVVGIGAEVERAAARGCLTSTTRSPARARRPAFTGTSPSPSRSPR